MRSLSEGSVLKCFHYGENSVINMSTEDQDNIGPPIMFVFGRML